MNGWVCRKEGPFFEMVVDNDDKEWETPFNDKILLHQTNHWFFP